MYDIEEDYDEYDYREDQPYDKEKARRIFLETFKNLKRE